VAITHAPSLPVADALAARARERGSLDPAAARALLIGAPSVSDADAERWHPQAIEVEAGTWSRWRELWPRPAELALAGEATPQALLGAAEHGIEVLQLVVHGLYDPERERFAGLLLGAGASVSGAVWAEHVEAARAPRWVLLATCGAATEIARRGGRSGLAAAFALAGSDVVVLTPNELELTGALDLFERVHTRLVEGAEPAAALRDARRALADRRGALPLQSALVFAWGAPAERAHEARAGAPSRASSAPAPSWRRRAWSIAGVGAASCVILGWILTRVVLARVRRSAARE
jgi:hypothetical protein